MRQEGTYRVVDLAIRYDVSEETVRNWIKAGLLPGTRKMTPGRKTSPYLIPESAVQKLDERFSEAETSS